MTVWNDPGETDSIDSNCSRQAERERNVLIYVQIPPLCLFPPR